MTHGTHQLKTVLSLALTLAVLIAGMVFWPQRVSADAPKTTPMLASAFLVAPSTAAAMACPISTPRGADSSNASNERQQSLKWLLRGAKGFLCGIL